LVLFGFFLHPVGNIDNGTPESPELVVAVDTVGIHQAGESGFVFSDTFVGNRAP